MKTQTLDSNCKVLLINGLGTVHFDKQFPKESPSAR